MSTSVLAAGCMISNSFMIVAPSLEMVTPCRQMAFAAKTNDRHTALSRVGMARESPAQYV